VSYNFSPSVYYHCPVLLLVIVVNLLLCIIYNVNVIKGKESSAFRAQNDLWLPASMGVLDCPPVNGGYCVDICCHHGGFQDDFKFNMLERNS
jgi:hypothetical protein